MMTLALTVVLGWQMAPRCSPHRLPAFAMLPAPAHGEQWIGYRAEGFHDWNREPTFLVDFGRWVTLADFVRPHLSSYPGNHLGWDRRYWSGPPPATLCCPEFNLTQARFALQSTRAVIDSRCLPDAAWVVGKQGDAADIAHLAAFIDDSLADYLEPGREHAVNVAWLAMAHLDTKWLRETACQTLLAGISPGRWRRAARAWKVRPDFVEGHIEWARRGAWQALEHGFGNLWFENRRARNVLLEFLRSPDYLTLEPKDQSRLLALLARTPGRPLPKEYMPASARLPMRP